MRKLDLYFRNGALDKLKRWAHKFVKPEVEMMVIMLLPNGQSGVISLVNREMTQLERLKLLEGAINAITSQAADATHAKF